MRIERAALIAALLSALVAGPAASAQRLEDDVRCLMVSSGYARLAKDDKTRGASAMTSAFFLGRLSGRLSERAVSKAIQAQGKGMSGKEAEPIMRACAARAGAAEQQMTATVQRAQSGK